MLGVHLKDGLGWLRFLGFALWKPAGGLRGSTFTVGEQVSLMDALVVPLAILEGR